MDFKRPHNVLIERRNEDNERLSVPHQSTDDLDAIHHRHLDVEKNEIWLLIANERYRFLAIAALTDDVQIVLLLEQLHNYPAGKWLIIDDKDATLH
jgi:hypothetical protein